MNLNFTDLSSDVLGLVFSHSPPSVYITMQDVCKSFRSLGILKQTSIRNKFGSNWKDVMINDSLTYNNVSHYTYNLKVLGLSINREHLSIAAFYGSLKILKLLSGDLERCHYRNVCDNAAKGGHLKILKWVREKGTYWEAKTCAYAALGGHPEVLKWLREEGCPWNERIPECAAAGGHLEILRWAIENDCPWNHSVCAAAAGGGHLGILKWTKEKGCDWNQWTCINAARNGHIDILRYVRSQNLPCPWSEKACTGAAKYGHLETLKWLRENGCPWDERTCLRAALEAQYESLEWAIQNGCPYDEETCARVIGWNLKILNGSSRSLRPSCYANCDEYTREMIDNLSISDLRLGLAELKNSMSTVQQPPSEKFLRDILNEWFDHPSSDSENTKSGSPEATAKTDFVKFNYTTNRYEFQTGWQDQFIQLPYSVYRIMVDSASDEQNFGWIAQTYFSQHDQSGIGPRNPTKVIALSNGLVFFYWEPINGNNDKDAKTKLIPSLWDYETSLKLSKIPIKTGQEATDLHKLAQEKLGLNEDQRKSWKHRRFVIALLYRMYEDKKSFRDWVDSVYTRGIPSLFNHALGHEHRSSQWKAYWWFYIQKKKREQRTDEFVNRRMKEDAAAIEEKRERQMLGGQEREKRIEEQERKRMRKIEEREKELGEREKRLNELQIKIREAEERLERQVDERLAEQLKLMNITKK